MKCDLHIHSALSPDSAQDLSAILAAAARAGLELVGVCDHNALHPPAAAPSHPKVRLLLGCEFSTDIGHIVGYFIDDTVFDGLEKERAPWPAERVLDNIAAAGGIAILAHPCAWPDDAFERCVERFDAVEVYNARAACYGRRDANRPAIARFAADELPLLAVSDAHLPEEIGQAYTELNLTGEALNAEGLRRALRQGGPLYGTPAFPDHSARSGLIRRQKCGGTVKRLVRLYLKLIYGQWRRWRYRRQRLDLCHLKGELRDDLISMGARDQ